VDAPSPQSLVRPLRSLVFLDPRFEWVSGGVWSWEGERPGPGWHAHGWTSARLTIAIGGGESRTITLLKRRWLNPDPHASPRTVHDRPPDDLGTRYDAVIVAAVLWCWLQGERGVHTFELPFHQGPSARTVLRWHRKARPNALGTQHAIRERLIERHEPRPIEQLFPGGVSPPGCTRRRGWRDLGRTSTLCRGLTLLFRGAGRLSRSIPTPALLAEARGKVTHPRTTVLF
jgi:hypothetical protein